MPIPELPQTPEPQPLVPDVHQQIKDLFDDRTIIEAIAGSRQDIRDDPGATRARQGRHAAAALNAIDDLNLQNLGRNVVSSDSSTPLPQRPTRDPSDGTNKFINGGWVNRPNTDK